MADTQEGIRKRTALVLGAGGTVGIAYHAGVLKALSDAGLDPAGADVIVGTSAGAIVGPILRAGHNLDEIWRLAHDDVNPFMEDAPFFRPEVVFAQAWRTPLGLARRVVGSGYVLQRSVVRWPAISPPRALANFYRGGLGSVTEQRREFVRWVGEEWPERDLHLCTFDLVTGKRLVLDNRRSAEIKLADAMRASGAVPVLYPPVRMGRRFLVDGGIHSSTNLDVAVKAGAELVVVVAPMALDRSDPPSRGLRVYLQHFQRRLERELGVARAARARVLLITPNARGAEVHGFNLMRSGGNREVADLAYERATEILQSPRAAGFVSEWKSAGQHTDSAA